MTPDRLYRAMADFDPYALKDFLNDMYLGVKEGIIEAVPPEKTWIEKMIEDVERHV